MDNDSSDAANINSIRSSQQSQQSKNKNSSIDKENSLSGKPDNLTKKSNSHSSKNKSEQSSSAKEDTGKRQENLRKSGGFNMQFSEPNEENKNQEQEKINNQFEINEFPDNNPPTTYLLIDKLIQAYNNYSGEVRSNTFQKILNNQDIMAILKELCRKDLEDIVVYILDEFTLDQKMENTGNLNEQNLNEKEEKYKDLYFLAIKKGQIKILEALEKQDLNYTAILDEENNTGLILAVIYSNIQIAKFFLKNSIDMLEITNKHGFSPLMLAVYNNDNLMFFLLANNLEFVITDGNSLYELAIRNENLDIINYLNPYKNKNKCNFDPSPLLLHFAVCQSSLEVFKTIADLIKIYDYQIQSSLETPLHWAAMKGNYYIVKELIKIYKENQIDLDKKNIYGVTPFMLANLRQDKNICQLFFENGVDVNEQDIEGNSIAHLIAGLGDVKWLKFMIKKFNVNCYLKNNKGDTPFIHAVLNENIPMVKYFIELFKNSKQLVSTNINWRNKYGQTPLHAAVFTGNKRIIEILLKNKADISVFDANDLTPYHYAYIEEKEDVVNTIHETLGVDKFDFIK